MRVGRSLPLLIIHISAQLKVFKVKIYSSSQLMAKIINNGENVGSKIRREYWWKYLKIKFSQIANSYNSYKITNYGK